MTHLPWQRMQAHPHLVIMPGVNGRPINKYKHREIVLHDHA
jgi:hypothetical protein